MSAPLFSIKTGWPVLAAAGLGIVAGFLLRPDRESGSASARPPGNPLANLSKNSPLGRSHALPQTEARVEALRKAGSPTQQIAAALAFAEITSVEEIRDLLENAHRFPSHSAEEVAIGTLLKRWLELDAAGAVEYCRQKKAEFLPDLLTNWGRDHPAEAASWVQAMPAGPARKEAWLGLCIAEAVRDPDKAWEMLGRTAGGNPHIPDWELESTIQAIVARDVEKALASLETMPPALVATAQRAIAQQLVKTDPARSWEWARQLTQPHPVMVAALGSCISSDPAQALALMKSLPTGELDRIVADLAGSVNNRNAPEFTALLRRETGMPESVKQQIAQNLFRGYIWTDPQAGLELISLMSPEGQLNAIKHSVENWARHNPATLRSWVEDLPEGPLRAAALETQARFESAEKPIDPANPESLVDGLKRSNYIQESDPRLSLVTPDKLGKMMMGGRADENYYQQTNLLFKVGRVNPAVAASWLERTPLDSKTGPMAAQFSAQWAETDPAAAGAWVSKLPPGNLAVNAAANVARQYHRYAPDQAAAWAAQLPPGPVQDAANKAITGK